MLFPLYEFTGGLQLRSVPYFLNANQSVVCSNALIESGGIKPMDSDSQVSSEGGEYFANYYAESGINQWFYSSGPMLYIDFKKKFYKSAANSLETIKQFTIAGTDEGEVGVKNPTQTPTMTQAASSSPFFIDEVYSYVFTYVLNGVESAPSTSNDITVTADGNSIDITTPVAADESVDSIRIYRLGGGGTEYLRLTDFIGGTFTDEVAAADLGLILTSEGNQPPENDLILDCVYNSRLVGHVKNDSTLRLSNAVSVEEWSESNTIPFDSNIVKAIDYNGQLLVFCKTAVYRLIGDTVATFTKTKMPTEQGCISAKSIVNYDGYVFWQSYDGICMFDGADVKVISATVFKNGYLNGRELISEKYNDTIYMGDENGIFKISLLFGNVVTELDSIPGMTNLFYNAADDSLYISTLTKTYKMFDDSTKRTLNYKTGYITCQSSDATVSGMHTLKAFRNIWISGSGDMQIKLYADGVLKATHDVILTTKPQELFYPPLTRAYYTELEFIGDGEISQAENSI